MRPRRRSPQHGLTRADFLQALLQATRTAAAMFTVLNGATLFGYYLTVTQTPRKVTAFITGLGLGCLLVIMGMYAILGGLMDAKAMIVLTVPIIFPVITELGFDPVCFGATIVMTVELGLIHLPVGMNVFVIETVVKDVSFPTISVGGAAIRGHRPDPAGDPDVIPRYRALVAVSDVGWALRSDGKSGAGALAGFDRPVNDGAGSTTKIQRSIRLLPDGIGKAAGTGVIIYNRVAGEGPASNCLCRVLGVGGSKFPVYDRAAHGTGMIFLILPVAD